METDSNAAVLAIQVGNSRIKFGAFRGAEPEEIAFVAVDDLPLAVATALRLYELVGAETDSSVLLASVNKPVSEKLLPLLREELGCELYLVPEDMAVPIGTCLDANATAGIDRLLNAAAAWGKLKQACIVIDAGTCITVDFIDGEGVFHGGAIAPGLRMQLKALHQQTAALPQLELAFDAFDALQETHDEKQPTPWGTNTRDAMMRGVYHGVRGLAWRLIEKYAEAYGGFPPVIATGGDAAVLFGEDELINQVVPDLVLRGMVLAANAALTPDAVDDDGLSSPRAPGFSLLPSQTQPSPRGSQARQKTKSVHRAGCDEDGCDCGDA